MEDFIEVKGVTFQRCNDRDLNLRLGDLVTPVWKRKKCVRLLITRSETGETIFVDTNNRDLYIPISINIVRISQGVTYVLNEDCYLRVQTVMISFYKVFDYAKTVKEL